MGKIKDVIEKKKEDYRFASEKDPKFRDLSRKDWKAARDAEKKEK